MPKKDSIKLSKQKIDIIAKAVKNGLPYKTAMSLAGVSESAFYRYKAMAEAIDNPKKAKDKTLMEFWQSLKKAEAEAIERNVLLIQNAAGTTWTAAAWWLERRFPEEFGRRLVVDANVKVDTANKRLEEYMTGEDVDRLVDEG